MEALFALILGSLLAGGLLITNDQSDDDDGNGGTDENRPTEGDDDLTVDATALGGFDALGGDDTVSVEATTDARFGAETPLQNVWNTDDTEPPLTISGGAGDDTLNLSGNGYAVDGGAGADRINLGNADWVTVSAGTGDTVVGGSGANVSVLLTGNAEFDGSASSNYVVNQSSGVVDTAGGNDTVLGVGGGASSVSGGAGDDVIVGTVSQSAFLPSATDLLSFFVSTDADTLDGGAGNDRIQLSHGDQVTGGEGADSLTLYTDDDGDLDEATITDFDPAQDQLLVFYGSYNSETPAPLAGEITVTETPEGDTLITGTDGQVLARLEGVTGVTVGLQAGELEPLTNLSGTPTPGASYDVLVMRYPDVTS